MKARVRRGRRTTDRRGTARSIRRDGSLRAPAPGRSGKAGATTPVAERAARARRLGHRPGSFTVGGEAGRVTLRRKTYLADADELVYKDTEKTDLELAYIGKHHARRQWPLFADHGEVTARKEEYERRWLGWDPRTRQETFGNCIDQWVKGHLPLTGESPPNLGDTYVEEQETLRSVDLKGMDKFNRIAAVLAKGHLLYRNVGGGSRLPYSKGTLYAGPEWDESSKEAILSSLGLPEGEFGKFGEVTFQQIDEEDEFRSRRETLEREGANLFDGDTYFYASEVEAPPRRPTQRPVQADGQRYDADFSDLDDLGRLERSYRRLTRPAGSGWVDGSQLNSTDRGEGQVEAMGNWNAYGAAAFATKYFGRNHYPLERNWEWLHVRGAQIGGQTEGGNLTPGLFATNSAMIPYESLIAHWAQHDVQHTEARFRVEGGEDVFVDRIILEVRLDGNHELLEESSGEDPADSRSLSVTFYPTEGRVVDRLASTIETLPWEETAPRHTLGKRKSKNGQSSRNSKRSRND